MSGVVDDRLKPAMLVQFLSHERVTIFDSVNASIDRCCEVPGGAVEEKMVRFLPVLK